MKKKRKRRAVKLCPVCHNTDIELLSGLSGWLTPEIYICRKCGYKGPIILELEVSENENYTENSK